VKEEDVKLLNFNVQSYKTKFSRSLFLRVLYENCENKFNFLQPNLEHKKKQQNESNVHVSSNFHSSNFIVFKWSLIVSTRFQEAHSTFALVFKTLLVLNTIDDKAKLE
jgi:hypothetical protein